ncbi:MAG: MerR family transcriptional regulator [Actinomycetota bacterium]|nr:MerR family transcriptional regulator [Actinomycetota bacterium]MDH5312730.1 MerR family transcriptional regulator [Actinomycetota bacterium]
MLHGFVRTAGRADSWNREVEIEGARVRMEGFTAHQACKFTECTPRQLRYWDEIGLVKPSVQGTGGRPGVPRLYEFRDLVALRVVKSLLDGGMSLQRVRRSWEFLNKKAGMDKHLSEVKLVTDGQSIFKICRRDGEVMDALRDGQMAFFVAIDDIASSVDTDVRQFQDDREKFVRALREAAAQTITATS